METNTSKVSKLSFLEGILSAEHSLPLYMSWHLNDSDYSSLKSLDLLPELQIFLKIASLLCTGLQNPNHGSNPAGLFHQSCIRLKATARVIVQALIPYELVLVLSLHLVFYARFDLYCYSVEYLPAVPDTW